MFTKCDICHKGIENNEPHHTINFHRERGANRSVTVEYAETILTTCLSCGRNINKDAVARVLSVESSEKARMLGELFIYTEVN